MRIIEQIVDAMQEELHDAEKYTTKALEHKDGDRELADMYYGIARQELQHADIEHDQAVRIIRDYGNNREVPPTMQAIWDWEHKKLTEHKADIIAMLDAYKR